MKDLFNQFKVARKNQKVSLEDVSNELKISRYYLEAIENCNLQLLPDPVYAIGFIKNYAKFLYIDHTEMVAYFKKERLLQKDISVQKSAITN